MIETILFVLWLALCYIAGHLLGLFVSELIRNYLYRGMQPCAF